MVTFRHCVAHWVAILLVGPLSGIPTKAQEVPVVGIGANGYHTPLVAEGHEFRPLDNPAYPNFKLTSVESVRLVLQVSDGLVIFSIERMGVNTQTALAIEGLPANSVWYRHEDGQSAGEYTTDAAGKFMCEQDLTQLRTVVFSPATTTLFVTTNTILTSDLSDSVVIAADGVTFDGGGFTVSNPATSGNGITVIGRRDVTIRNVRVTGFTNALHLSNTRFVRVENATLHGNGNGIFSSTSAGNVYGANEIRDNTNGVIAVFSNSDSLTNSSLLRNAYAGVSLAFGGSPSISGNSLSEGALGIVLQDLNFSSVEDNTLAAFSSNGISIFSSRPDFVAVTNHLVKANTISGTTLGLVTGNMAQSVVRNNTISATQNDLVLNGLGNAIFHNNFLGPSVTKIFAFGFSTFELSHDEEGNFWDRTCPGPLFVPGVDSNGPIDSFPYGTKDAWLLDVPPGCPSAPPPTPAEQIDALATQVREALQLGSITDVGVAQSLLAKLDAAGQSVDRSALEGAIGQINAFAQNLEAQSGKAVEIQFAHQLASLATNAIVPALQEEPGLERAWSITYEGTAHGELLVEHANQGTTVEITFRDAPGRPRVKAERTGARIIKHGNREISLETYNARLEDATTGTFSHFFGEIKIIVTNPATGLNYQQIILDKQVTMGLDGRRLRVEPTLNGASDSFNENRTTVQHTVRGDTALDGTIGVFIDIPGSPVQQGITIAANPNLPLTVGSFTEEQTFRWYLLDGDTPIASVEWGFKTSATIQSLVETDGIVTSSPVTIHGEGLRTPLTDQDRGDLRNANQNGAFDTFRDLVRF
ncbi:MAG: right-handed parallel beta-helix repeat-containing protein [Planctomycetes bacterium]|nr:right-handed parallel beta-helix repeat-containing protein [Planctomycetota bacterium]